MGVEAKQEQAPVEAKPAEEAKTEEKEEEEEAPRSPTPILLQVDLHCMGCAKKIERSIMRLKGVDRVVVDMVRNQITIKGEVEPQAVCAKITEKLKRSARVLSPLPAPAAETEPAKPDVVASEKAGGGLLTLVLDVNLHCEACAVQLKRKILKMRGVQTVEVKLSSGKVTATGTMDADKLVNYVYRRTRKQARIVPQAEPEAPKAAPEDEVKKAAEDEKLVTGSEDANNETAATVPTQPAEEEKKEENGEVDNKTDSAATTATDEAAAAEGDKREEESKEEEKKGEGDDGAEKRTTVDNFGFHCNDEEENMKKMMTCYYQPLYVIERVPPPQLFSDENPNACCIS